MDGIVFGYIGCALLIISLFPQLYKTYITKDVSALSIKFIVLQILTCSFILTYTTFKQDYPIMIANICLLIQFFVLLYFIYKYRDKKENIPKQETTISKNGLKCSEV